MIRGYKVMLLELNGTEIDSGTIWASRPLTLVEHMMYTGFVTNEIHQWEKHSDDDLGFCKQCGEQENHPVHDTLKGAECQSK